MSSMALKVKQKVSPQVLNASLLYFCEKIMKIQKILYLAFPVTFETFFLAFLKLFEIFNA